MRKPPRLHPMYGISGVRLVLFAHLRVFMVPSVDLLIAVRDDGRCAERLEATCAEREDGPMTSIRPRLRCWGNRDKLSLYPVPAILAVVAATETVELADRVQYEAS